MNLILFANGFPYGNWEPYLETEIKYYQGFSAVHICSMQLRKEHKKVMRPLPSDNFHVCPVPFAPMVVYLLNAFRALGDRNFYGELSRLIKEKKFSLLRFAWLVFYFSRAHHEARIIRKYLTREGVIGSGEETVLYSYRFDYQPYVALLLKKYFPSCKIIARGHRYDLYENCRRSGYIPMRPYLLEHLDKVLLIADDGKTYLESCYPIPRDKLAIFRLGTADYGNRSIAMDGRSIRLVSCSTLIPLKRVHLIVAALKEITELEVYWAHYGSGELMPEIQRLCADLPQNIHYELHGYVPNSILLEEYLQNPYHLFLNVSSSEGIPVSIMEAMSSGIPCIATDVGGVAELVKNGKNGILLPADFAPETLAEHIRTFAAMEDEDYQVYRRQAQSFWLEHYSADTNYTRFNAYLHKLGGD